MLTSILIILFLLLAFGICFLLVRRHYLKAINVAVKRAQKSEQLKSVFIENISRTLRSPLETIKGYSDKILEEKGTLMQPELVRKSLTDISDYAKELLDFVLQLHEMSKFEGITPTATFIEVNLSELMASYRREAMNYTKPDVGVRVTTELSPHCRAILDTNLMHQLMMHLLTNAAHHVTHGDIFIRYTCERRGLKVSISYTGIELTDMTNGDIFLYLQQEDNMKESCKSSVLGLAICRAIVDMFAGEFFVDSENGKKTVVSFWFPCEMKDVYRDI